MNTRKETRMFKTNDVLFGKYRVESYVGRGSFGEVYRVTTQTKDSIKERAVKVLKNSRELPHGKYEEIAYHFRKEAEICQNFFNTYIVHVDEVCEEGDLLGMVMEFVSGGTLFENLQHRKQTSQVYSVDEVIEIATQLAEGLAELHNRDIVHRDLKPQNILCDPRGRHKIADLGLAQVMGGYGSMGFSEAGSRIEAHRQPGTPAYMSPEQETNTLLHLPSASDIFSLGAILFEMLTLKGYKNQPGQRVGALRQDIPDWLDTLLADMLAEEVKDRPPDGTALLDLLKKGPENTQPIRHIFPSGQSVQEVPQEMRTTIRLNLGAGVTLELLQVGGGDFLIGSSLGDKLARENEMPQHTLFLDDFWISRFPVTVAQFFSFVRKTNYETTAQQEGSRCHWALPRGSEDDIRKKLQHPVTQVSWYDALSFCAWLEQNATGPFGNKLHFRLPSEAEWEKAARGGLSLNPSLEGKANQARTYPWGNTPPDAGHANYDMLHKDTTAVGDFSPLGDSPFGCADMAGNVWEWTSTLYRAYPYHTGDQRENTQMRGERVLRGGAFNLNGASIRCAIRHHMQPEAYNAFSGFRICAISEKADRSQ